MAFGARTCAEIRVDIRMLNPEPMKDAGLVEVGGVMRDDGPTQQALEAA